MERAIFVSRHVGITQDEDVHRALDAVGIESLDALMDAAVPKSIRERPAPVDRAATPHTDTDTDTDTDTGSSAGIRSATPRAEDDWRRALPEPADEQEVLAELRELAARNTPMRQMIGQGFSDTVTPAVLRRNILENPAWYTAYTPYQPEISQGRLEALMVFQTMVADLTGLPVANASLLDESSAAAEAMLLMKRAASRGRARPPADDPLVLVDADVFPQTLAVLRGRARAAGLSLVVADLSGGLDNALREAAGDSGTAPAGSPSSMADGEGGHSPAQDAPLAGIILQNPGDSGLLRDWAPVIAQAHERGALATVIADVLALTLVTPPGEMGADIAVGSTQRFGVPLFFGGPHAAYMAVTEPLTRQLPGRLVGISHDDAGTPAFRLALQTREQHIRRERATSNICTAQALLAVVAAMYAVHHGPDGLRAIARRAHGHAVRLARGLVAAGFSIPTLDEGDPRGGIRFFDTVRVAIGDRDGAGASVAAAVAAGINIRRVDATTVSVSTDETTTDADIDALLGAFGVGTDRGGPTSAEKGTELGGEGNRSRREREPKSAELALDLRRTSSFLTHPVFHEHRSETSLMRYLRRLSDRDLALDRTMIPLGSCTLKLNAAVEMEAISWPGLAGIHPFAPADQTRGWRALTDDLERWLAAVSGYDAVTLQPNSGATGEYTGLQAIRLFHLSQGHPERTVCLIPASAHGTNAASAALAGLDVVGVATAPDGTIDVDDLRAQLAAHAGRVAAIMVTYPSTHGVYEPQIREVCALVHDAGGQVYIDGANLNALIGAARPGRFGGDVSHLNLHKTFCIPHGGGGPGVGPVAARAHLAPFLPGVQAFPVAAPSDEDGPGAPSRAGAPTGPGTGCEADAAPGGATAPDRTTEPSGAPSSGGLRASGTRPGGPPSSQETRTGAPVAATTYGSAGVLPISWAYIRLMGGQGLARATQGAVLAANYVARSLAPDFPILYVGPGGLVAHECILDLRELTRESGITAEDVAKRLIDFGFHAPTLAFPVPGTLMVEPTESEDLGELDRFIAAMHAIRGEIQAVIDGSVAADDSVLRRAPHTAAVLMADRWDRPYTRSQAAALDAGAAGTAAAGRPDAFAGPGADKYLPPVGRIDGAFGDRHLVATLPSSPAAAPVAPASPATPVAPADQTGRS